MKLPEFFMARRGRYEAKLAQNLEAARALAASTAGDSLAAQATADALPGNQFAVAAARVFKGFEARAHRLLAAGLGVADRVATAPQEGELESLAYDQREADEHIQLYGPPGVYRRCTFDNYEVTTDAQARAVHVARWFTQGSPDGLVPKAQTLVLAGPTGTGKTHLAAAAFLAAVSPQDYHHFGWIAAPRLLRLLQNAKEDYLEKLIAHFGDGEADLEADENGEYDRDLFGAKFLVIDDLGTGTASERALEHLADVIDRRTGRGLTTVITTNADRAELEEYLGSRCNSRLKWRGIRCPLGGADHRELPAPAWVDAPPPELPQIAERRAVITAELAEARKRAALLRAEALASLERVVAITASDTGITAAFVSDRTVAAAYKNLAEVVRILAGYGAKRGSDLKPEQWAPYLEELDALEGKADAVSPLEQLPRLEAAS